MVQIIRRAEKLLACRACNKSWFQSLRNCGPLVRCYLAQPRGERWYLDTLPPDNGAVIPAGGGLTHEEAYNEFFAITLINSAAGFS